MPLRMSARIRLGHVLTLNHLSDPRVIHSQLANPLVADEISATIAHMRQRHSVFSRQERGHQSRPHPMQSAFFPGATTNLLMRPIHCMTEDFDWMNRISAERLNGGDGDLRRESARDLTRTMTSHPIGHQEKAQTRCHRISIFIHRPMTTDIGPRSGSQSHGKRDSPEGRLQTTQRSTTRRVGSSRALEPTFFDSASRRSGLMPYPTGAKCRQFWPPELRRADASAPRGAGKIRSIGRPRRTMISLGGTLQPSEGPVRARIEET